MRPPMEILRGWMGCNDMHEVQKYFTSKFCLEMLKVYKTCCGNCLLSKNRIVSPERAKDIIQGCKKKQTHFICHKSDDIVCRKFYDEFGYFSQTIRIMERFNLIEFVDQKESKKLPTWAEMEKR